MDIKKILAIETSCDETAAAVYDTQQGIQSNVIFTQLKVHSKYGGVVPNIASELHVEKIGHVVHAALEEAGTLLNAIDLVAVTTHPGLHSSLLVGFSYAKALAWSLQKPLIGINHLEGHIFSSFLEHTVPFPHLCLTASGGHTALYIVHDFGKFEIVAQTVDDAAGEAFDKISKLIGLGYPGGPIIEKYAHKAHFKDFFNYPRAGAKMDNFSFSGLKTAILYDLIKKNAYDTTTKKYTAVLTEEMKEQIASSLLVCIKDIFIEKIKKAYEKYPHVQALTFVGGVACNRYLQNALQEYAQSHNLPFFFPARNYCTDNAAMIAFVASYQNMKQYESYTTDLHNRQ